MSYIYILLSFLFAFSGISTFIIIIGDTTNLRLIILPLVAWSISFLFYSAFKKNKKRKELIERGRQESARIKKEIEEKQKIINKRVTEIESNLKFKAILAKNVGGSGYPLNQNQEINFSTNDSSLVIIKRDESTEIIEIPFQEINELEISGPGTVTTNAGVSGGGFGLEGFIKGAVAAAIINAATTTKSTNTFMRILSSTGEIYLHTSAIEPAALKMKLSPLFVHLANRAKQPTITHHNASIAEEIKQLKQLLEDGVLSKEEFDAAKKKIIA